MNKGLPLAAFFWITAILVTVVFWLLSLSVLAQKADFGLAVPNLNYTYVKSSGGIVESNQILEGKSEQLFRRTESSQTFCNGLDCTLKLYAGKQFEIQNNIWYKYDTYLATSTKDVQLLYSTPVNLLDLFIAPAYAQSTSTGSSNAKDSSMYDRSPTTNYGSANILYTFFDPAGAADTLRSLVSFTLPDLSGTINNIDLVLKVQEKKGDGNITVHDQTRSTWSELEADWNEYATGNNWSTAGGDFDASSTDIVVVGNAGDWMYFDIYGTGTLKEIVVDWNEQLDLELKSETETGGSLRGANFHSKEATNSAERPYLLINYTEAGETGTTTTATSTYCEMTAGAIDNDVISEYLLYFFYVMLSFIILTLGYWIVDRFFHSLGGRKYD